MEVECGRNDFFEELCRCFGLGAIVSLMVIKRGCRVFLPIRWRLLPVPGVHVLRWAPG